MIGLSIQNDTWWDIEGIRWKHIGHGLVTAVDIKGKEFRVRHIGALDYEVAVAFNYAEHKGVGLEKILDVVAADQEFWLLVEGALKHQMLKELKERGTDSITSTDL